MLFNFVLPQVLPRSKHLATLFARILNSPGPSMAALWVFGNIKANQPLCYPYQAIVIKDRSYMEVLAVEANDDLLVPNED